MKMTLLFSFVIIIGAAVLLSSCTGPGKPVGGDGPYHHLENGFRNPPNSMKRGRDLSVNLPFFMTMVKRSITGEKPPIPENHVLPADQAKAQFINQAEADSISWIGHATFLVRLDGVVVLTDPVFTRRASPVSFAGPARVIAPGLDIADLPQIDVVVISHAHYDHLDTRTLDLLPNRDKITAIVPLGLGSYFEKRGFGVVHEVDWYEDITLPSRSGEFRLTAYPAVHWSNRSPFDLNRSLWMSYGFSAGGRSVFHTGDTETHPTVFSDIGVHMAENHGGCDLGLMSIGAYEPRAMMKGAHTDPEGGVLIGREVGCKRMVPMHWGTFVLSTEPFDEPRTRFKQAAGNQSLVMRIGETIGFSDVTGLDK
jgi:L-ascorbate metabolism protein UlaG (beta-lactamase superfamily)